MLIRVRVLLYMYRPTLVVTIFITCKQFKNKLVTQLSAMLFPSTFRLKHNITETVNEYTTRR